MTRFLAIETSLTSGSLALFADGRPVGEVMLPPAQRIAQSLVPAIGRLLAQASWRPGDLDMVAAAVGPGSFTGLRVGITTAKVLAYVTNAEVVAVSTLEAIAVASGAAAGIVCPVIDAQRKQLFCARYRCHVDGLTTEVEAERIVALDDWLAELAPDETVTGPGLSLFEGRLPRHVVVTDPGRWMPAAVHVGRIAWLAYQQGRRDDVWKLAPRYLRASAAEEKAGQAGVP